MIRNIERDLTIPRPHVNGIHLTRASPHLITFIHIH